MSIRPHATQLYRALASAVASLAIALPAASQTTCGPLSLQVSPDPAPRGALITATATNTGSTTIWFLSTCVFSGIHQGSPSGPSMRPIGCDQVSFPLHPGARSTLVWDQLDQNRQPAAPGVYYFNVQWPTPCSIPVRIEGCSSGSVTSYGQPCGTPSCFLAYPPRIEASTCAQIGSTFGITATGYACQASGYGPPALLWIGTSRTRWAGTPLPLALPDGCLLETSIDVVISEATFMGRTSFRLPIPPLPLLRGQAVYVQGAHLDDIAHPPRLILTNGLQVVIG